MSGAPSGAACRTHALEAWLTGALSSVEAAAVEAHVRACGACAHSLSWLKLERAWMAQRARRTPPRSALQWEQLEARLSAAATLPPSVAASGASLSAPLPGAPPPAPVLRVPARRAHRPAMALGAVAAVVLVSFSLLLSSSRRVPEGTEAAGLEACVDPVGEAMSALEVRVGACLVASPVLTQR